MPKQPLAKELHQKALQTDANMKKGDWLAGLAGVLKNSVAQLMNKRPTDFDGKPEPIPDKVQHELERLDWVQQARVRLREDGDVLTGEAFIMPRDESDLLNRLRNAYDVANAVDWRLHDVNIVPVRSLE